MTVSMGVVRDLDRFIEESVKIHGSLEQSLNQVQHMVNDSLQDNTLPNDKMKMVFAMLHDIRERQQSLDKQVDGLLDEESEGDAQYPANGVISLAAAANVDKNDPATWRNNHVISLANAAGAWSESVDEYAEISFWGSRFPWRDFVHSKDPKRVYVDMTSAFESRAQFFRWCRWFSIEVPLAAQSSPKQYVHISTLSLADNSLSSGRLFEIVELLLRLSMGNQLQIDRLILRSTDLEDSSMDSVAKILKNQPMYWPIKELDISHNNISDGGIEALLELIATCNRYPHGQDTQPLILHVKNTATRNLPLVLAKVEETHDLTWSSKTIRRTRQTKKTRNSGKDKLPPQVLIA